MVNSSPGPEFTPSVLLVEDNPGDARLVQEAFDETQFTDALHVVSEGAEAIDFVSGRGAEVVRHVPKLILLDWHLPRMDGAQLLKKLRDDHNLPPIPIIVLTGSQADRKVADIYENHANACLPKPGDPQEFIDAIQVAAEFWLSIARLPGLSEETN